MAQRAFPPYAPNSLQSHAVIDVALVLAGYAGSAWLAYTGELLPAAYATGLTTFGLIVNLLTNYPGGVIAKALPMRWHQFLEWISPAPFILAPWLLFPQSVFGTWLLTGIGIAVVLNTALTQKLKEAAEPAAS